MKKYLIDEMNLKIILFKYLKFSFKFGDKIF